MENIILASVDQKIKDFIAMPAGPLKNLKYNTIHSGGYEASIVYKEGCMYYGCTGYKLSKGKHSYFLKATTKDGFTLDEKGKLKIWYGKNPKKLPRVDEVIQALGNDWYKSDYTILLTKGMLEKILNRKITNPLGFCEAWLKAQHIKASPRLMFKAVNAAGVFTVYSYLLKYQSIFEHMDQFLERIIDHYSNNRGLMDGNFMDLCDQAVIMETKVDPYWSAKRVEIEHHRMTQEIMQLQLSDVENTPIEGLDSIRAFIADNEYVTLLDNERAVFMEGKLMSHCIYTNYWSKIKSRSILCFHVNYRGQKGTLTVQLGREQFTQALEYQIYDFKDKHNREPGEDASWYVKDLVRALNVYMNENKITVPMPVIDTRHIWDEETHVLPF